MKVKIFKKEDKGFALLFSVLISSLIMTIGLSILSISIKELAISIASKQSVHAFYAADSGLECAKYWDLKQGYILNLVDKEAGTIGRTGSSITCGGGTSQPLGDIIPSTDSYSTTFNNATVGTKTDNDQANFDVTITKTWHDSIHSQIDTTIVSTGHNSTGGDRVERAIQQTY